MDSSPETYQFSQNPADLSSAGVEKGGSYPQTGTVIHRYEKVIHRNQPVFDGEGWGRARIRLTKTDSVQARKEK
jgi:hypothetical protein